MAEQNNPAPTKAGAPNEGTQDIASAAGGIQASARAASQDGPDVRPDEHQLAGGKSPDDVRRFLQDVSFPAKKEAVIRAATRQGAPDEVVSCLSGLPATEYASFDDVIRDYPRLPEPEDFVGRGHAGQGIRF